jgi:hypothetical protein
MRKVAKGNVSNPAAICTYNPKIDVKFQASFTRDKSWKTRKRKETTRTNSTIPEAK